MTLRLCSRQGCTELGKHSHYAREYAKDRPSAAKMGYDRHWQRLRAMKLRDEPLCRACKAEGRIVAANEVDHRTPKSQGGTDDWENLQSLCKSHHSEKTAREDGGFGKRRT